MWPRVVSTGSAYGGISRIHEGTRFRSSRRRWRQRMLHRSEMYLLKSRMLSMPVNGLFILCERHDDEWLPFPRCTWRGAEKCAYRSAPGNRSVSMRPFCLRSSYTSLYLRNTRKQKAEKAHESGANRHARSDFPQTLLPKSGEARTVPGCGRCVTAQRRASKRSSGRRCTATAGPRTAGRT